MVSNLLILAAARMVEASVAKKMPTLGQSGEGAKLPEVK